MAAINPAEISAILKKQLSGFTAVDSVEEVGNRSNNWGWYCTCSRIRQMHNMVS